MLYYRRITSDPAKQWLRILKKEDVQVIICLSHADRFYAECIDDCEDKSPKSTEDKERKIRSLLNVNNVYIAIKFLMSIFFS